MIGTDLFTTGESTGHDTYYVGPINLERLHQFMVGQRTVHEYKSTRTTWVVELSSCTPETCDFNQDPYDGALGCSLVAEWGTSTQSLDDAWRYAFGAFAGPSQDEPGYYLGDDYWRELLGIGGVE